MSSNVDVIATGTEDTVLSKNEKKIKKCFLSQKKVVTCAKIEQLENFI